MLTPFDLKAFIQQTPLEAIMDTNGIKLAIKLNEGIQAAWTYCAERPRWANWWDQISRSSSSIVLNLAEAYGKGRGYFCNAAMIARGEAYETAAALVIGPKDVCEPLLPLAKQLVEAINSLLLATDLEKPDTPRTLRSYS